MPIRSLWKLLCCALAFSICCPLLLNADVTASVSGHVFDSSGAAVEHADVTLEKLDTGLVRRVKTSANGSYEFLSVAVGDNYALQVQAPGFQTISQTGIKLEVNQKYRADFSLKVGAINEKVEVSASKP